VANFVGIYSDEVWIQQPFGIACLTEHLKGAIRIGQVTRPINEEQGPAIDFYISLIREHLRKMVSVSEIVLL